MPLVEAVDITSAATRTERRGRLWIGLVIGVLLGVAVGWYVGVTQQPYSAVAEAKMCYHALTVGAGTLEPQTREYLKGRLYWKDAVEIRPGWLDGWRIDFGPVDDAALKGLAYIKDASTSEEIYQAALRRHPRSAIKP